ncbi:MAG: adenylosuccinate lyase [Lewinellaceae bacterium]|nr:adenylosuccinate lyase [Saprospiraceae bacterium]MCB9311587.1 adenylosuccinate lyase [Lewinellaceae bacterium]
MLRAISPVDGRYANKTLALQDFFSESALIRYRVRIEIVYFERLCRSGLPALAHLSHIDLSDIWKQFTEEDAQRIKEIEAVTNHDVKAVEYYLREVFTQRGLGEVIEFIHLGLTSQDINNTAIPLSQKEAFETVYLPELNKTVEQLRHLAMTWIDIPMLARTHGQPASPTRLGKELLVFVERLEKQIRMLTDIPFAAKFGGATGNFNAHVAAFPDMNWPLFADELCASLGLVRSQYTTQIEHYDMIAAHVQALSRINTILIDLCRDIWTYISMDYFKQKVAANEVGSSAMPHKVNPIDFENAEGNLGMANAISEFLASKLPVSRLQRDLTDSTVLRNIGLPYAYGLIALSSLQKGLGKLILNESRIQKDLEDQWAILAEAIQTILRRENYPHPYEALKQLTRGQQDIDANALHAFIHQLDLPDAVKHELLGLRPDTYIGVLPG